MLIETYYFIDKFLEDEYILSLLISNNDGNVFDVKCFTSIDNNPLCVIYINYLSFL